MKSLWRDKVEIFDAFASFRDMMEDKLKV